MATAGPIAGKRIGVEPKVWRSVAGKRIKQELKMLGKYVAAARDNTQITPSSPFPLAAPSVNSPPF